MFYDPVGGIGNYHNKWQDKGTKVSGTGTDFWGMLDEKASLAGRPIFGDIEDREANMDEWAFVMREWRNRRRVIKDDDEETWWDKRLKKMRERMREQVARNQAWAIEHSRLEREYYFQYQLVSMERQHALLMEALTGERSTIGNPFANRTLPANSTIPCESFLSTYIAFLGRSRTK